jgi:hypothetical protein
VERSKAFRRPQFDSIFLADLSAGAEGAIVKVCGLTPLARWMLRTLVAMIAVRQCDSILTIPIGAATSRVRAESGCTSRESTGTGEDVPSACGTIIETYML